MVREIDRGRIRLGDSGTAQVEFPCYLCGAKEFQATLNRLANKFEEIK